MLKKKQVMGAALAALCTGALATGCSATESEEVSAPKANIPELAVATGWENVKASYEAYDAEAQKLLDEINGSNVREKVMGYVDTITSLSPVILEAAESGDITAETEEAAEEIYKAAYVLDGLGNESGQDVSLYIKDISVDAFYLLENLYDNLPTDAQSKKSECDVNRDRILSFTDEEWDAYAQTL